MSFKICPFVQRVTALLEDKGLAYHIEFIDLSDKPHWFLDISPTGQVPLLIAVSGEPLFESDAIVEYINEIATPLTPDIYPIQRAQDRAWCHQAAKHYLVQCSAMQSKDKTILTEREAKLKKAFEKAESQLEDGPYFSGKELGNVDIAWLPLLHRAQIVKQRSGYDVLADYPKVRAWQSALADTGLFTKSVAGDFEEKFSDFYLADRTFLGCGADFPEAASGKAQRSAESCCSFHQQVTNRHSKRRAGRYPQCIFHLLLDLRRSGEDQAPSVLIRTRFENGLEPLPQVLPLASP